MFSLLNLTIVAMSVVVIYGLYSGIVELLDNKKALDEQFGISRSNSIDNRLAGSPAGGMRIFGQRDFGRLAVDQRGILVKTTGFRGDSYYLIPWERFEFLGRSEKRQECAKFSVKIGNGNFETIEGVWSRKLTEELQLFGQDRCRK